MLFPKLKIIPVRQLNIYRKTKYIYIYITSSHLLLYVSAGKYLCTPLSVCLHLCQFVCLSLVFLSL